MNDYSVVGKGLPRLDTIAKATGQAKYTVDMGLPTALETLEVRRGGVHSIEPKGPFGAKEVGEGAIAGALAAVANAVHDAVGVRIKSLPITPDKVLQAL